MIAFFPSLVLLGTLAAFFARHNQKLRRARMQHGEIHSTSWRNGRFDDRPRLPLQSQHKSLRYLAIPVRYRLAGCARPIARHHPLVIVFDIRTRNVLLRRT
jgi:hypothetical protein